MGVHVGMKAPAGGFQTLRPAAPPACTEYGDVIDRNEWALAKTWAEALPSAAKDADQICSGCPVQAQCLACAETEKYTGIAGGRVLSDGEVKA